LRRRHGAHQLRDAVLPILVEAVDLAEGQPAREAVEPGLQVRRRLRLAG
jgi:hypothetical protein